MRVYGSRGVEASVAVAMHFLDFLHERLERGGVSKLYHFLDGIEDDDIRGVTVGKAQVDANEVYVVSAKDRCDPSSPMGAIRVRRNSQHDYQHH
jgi:hypothetical protein